MLMNDMIFSCTDFALLHQVALMATQLLVAGESESVVLVELLYL